MDIMLIQVQPLHTVLRWFIIQCSLFITFSHLCLWWNLAKSEVFGQSSKGEPPQTLCLEYQGINREAFLRQSSPFHNHPHYFFLISYLVCFPDLFSSFEKVGTSQDYFWMDQFWCENSIVETCIWLKCADWGKEVKLITITKKQDV